MPRKPKKDYLDLVTKIKELVLQGNRIKEISKILEKPEYTVQRAISKNKIKYKSDIELIKERDLKIIQEFNSTEKSLKQIAKEFELSTASITLILQKYNTQTSTERKNKAREITCLEKYGVKNVMYDSNIIKNREDHFLNTLGVKTPFESKKIRERGLDTLELRTGYRNPSHNPETNIKRKNTNNNKYGGNAPACANWIKDKMSQSCSKRFGVFNYKQVHLSKRTLRIRSNSEYYKKLLTYLHHRFKFNLNKISILMGVEKSLISADMKKFQLKVMYFSMSNPENEIYNFIKNLDPTLEVVKRGNSLGTELDLYIPKLKLAIEYNGLFYHSYKRRVNSYKKYKHMIKTKKCKEQGIQLFHIFSNEWENNPRLKEIWQSILTRKIAPSLTRKIYARNTEVIQINKEVAKEFLKENHLQGYTSATLYYGLINKNKELLGVISFVKSKKEDGNWLLNRLAFKQYLTILGGASKLLEHFKRNNSWKTIESFSDFRYSYGDIYKTLGFEKIKYLPISYYYTDTKELFHKRHFQKQHLSKVLGEKYDPNKTEFENVVLGINKYRIVYDAGKLKFVLNNPTI